jgi:large subunit ribosomal protein L25
VVNYDDAINIALTLIMDRLSLKAEERKVLGKKVKALRKGGSLPAHVFGKGVEGENVTLVKSEFLKTFKMAGETGVIDLKIGAEKVRPVMVRDVQYDPVTNLPIHIDFYQVNLSQKVTVPVPIELIGEDPETVKLGEAIVLQTINEIEVEALPNDLVEKIEVDKSTLKAIDDAITVGQLNFDRTKLTISNEPEEVVVKLAPAVSAEMEALLEEQAAEQAAAAAEEGAAEGETPAEGEAKEGEQSEGGEATESGAEAGTENARAEGEPDKAE